MNTQERIEAAGRMADLFASVGAVAFDLSFKHLDEGEKTRFRGSQSLRSFKNSLPHLIPSSLKNQYSLIARPRSDQNTIVQLDDLDAEKARAMKGAAFLILETSPANFQAWLSIEGQQDEDFLRRLKQGTGADASASGATRWAGTVNFKAKYAPDFPTVRAVYSKAGHIVAKEALERAGMVAATLPAPPAVLRAHGAHSGRKWPSYAQCLKEAPPSESRKGKNRRDMADFTFSVIAADWGHSPDEIAARLMEESDKAKENGKQYAALTAQRAAAIVAARGRKQQGPRF